VFVPACVEIFRVWGVQPKTFLFLTHLTFFFNLFYYLRVSLAIIKVLDHDYREDIYYKVGFVFSFLVGFMYWMMYLQDPSLVNEKGYKIIFILDFFLHGGNFILYLLEHFLFTKHSSCDFIGPYFIAAIVLLYCAMLYTLYFAARYAIYPFLNEYKLVDFIALPIMGTGIALFGLFLHNVVTSKVRIGDSNQPIFG